MTEPVDPAVFIRIFLQEFFESRFLHGFLTTDQYHDFCADLRWNPKLDAMSRRLFKSSPRPLQVDSYGRLRVIYLREFDGSEFPFLQGLTQKRLHERKLTCFIGHRFLPGIESSLRYNLVHLFEPHAIALRWAGDDLSAGDLFASILNGIRGADLCLFDNLATANRPNVYIEIGIAYALGKPMLFCEHHGSELHPSLETGTVPSDLQGLLRIQYQSYQELCRKLYFGLPSFLAHHQLL